jgi:putative DNA methylase
MYAQNPSPEERQTRLIETVFPLERVSAESTREKNLRHGHISTLHIYWARRPLAASRATALAALLPDSPRRRHEWLQLIEALTPFEAVQDAKNPNLQKARALVREAYGGRAPRVLDPFAGGGSIPLEALRLGCEVHALDYNPLAVLLNRCVLEYPQRFGASGAFRGVLPSGKGEGLRLLEAESRQSPLVEAVAAYGEWVLEWAREHLEPFYPPDPDGAIPVGYLWARTIPCQNPICGAEIPLMRQTWLAKKEKKQVALRIVPDKVAKRVDFEIVEGEGLDFDPEQGTVVRAHARCPVCGETTDDKRVRALFQSGRAGERLVAVVLHYSDRAGKRYRLATAADRAVFERARGALEEWEARLRAEWGIEPVPDEPLPFMSGVFNVPLYGMTRWGDLFNARQRLALLVFAEGVRRAYRLMVEQGADAEFARAVATYLGLAMDMMAAFCNTLARWENTSEAIKQVFSRQALPMLWDFAELNPLSGSTGSWEAGWEYYLKVLDHLCAIPSVETPPKALHGTATELPYPDNHFDALFTDPPYYFNVPYADLSDFFYVWLKRAIGDLHPDLFATPLTPKSGEICQMEFWDSVRYPDKNKQWFEEQLGQAFREMHRVLKPDGIAIIVFAHKTTEAWETVLNALLRAGLYPTAALPIHTEMQARLRAQESAALASSIYLVCRKRVGARVGFWGDLKPQIVDAIERRLHQFWDAGVRGADLFISAIGPALAVFGQYARVERASGEAVGASVLLTLVREQVSRYALERILREREVVVELDALSQFYLLYRWSYGHAEVPFDEARKLAVSVGLELTAVWGEGRVIVPAQGKGGESKRVRVVSPLERAWGRGLGGVSVRGRRRVAPEQLAMGWELEEKPSEASEALWESLYARAKGSKVEALQLAAWMWESGQTGRLVAWLEREGLHRDRVLWMLAQAVADSLPEGDSERRLMQGLLGFSRRWEV